MLLLWRYCCRNPAGDVASLRNGNAIHPITWQSLNVSHGQAGLEAGEQSITEFQDLRLQQKAAPKTINEEVGFLLRLIGDMDDAARVRLRSEKLRS